MQELLLVNPRRRRAKSRKPRSAAQRAATARMLAANRRRNPAKRSARRKNPVTVLHTARRANPRRRHHARARRRNPAARISFGTVLSRPMSILKPALTGAIGAVLVNTAMAKLPLPAQVMAGRVRYLTQGAVAIGLAMLAQKVGVGGATAAKMAEGSLTVTLHDAIKDIAGGMGMDLGDMGYYLPGLGVQNMPSASGNPAPLMNGMGKYVSGPGSPASNVTAIGARMAGMRGMRGFNF